MQLNGRKLIFHKYVPTQVFQPQISIKKPKNPNQKLHQRSENLWRVCLWLSRCNWGEYDWFSFNPFHCLYLGYSRQNQAETNNTTQITSQQTKYLSILSFFAETLMMNSWCSSLSVEGRRAATGMSCCCKKFHALRAVVPLLTAATSRHPNSLRSVWFSLPVMDQSWDVFGGFWQEQGVTLSSS